MVPFTLNSFYFLLTISLLIFSGNILLKSFKLKFNSLLENFLLSFTFTLVVLSLLSYFLSLLSVQFLIRPIFWLFITLGFLNIFLQVRKRKFLIRAKFDWGLFLVVFVSVVSMSLITARSGWWAKDGLEFFGVNAHDGMWHLSLIGELKNHFPPQHPNFSGLELKGYHYLLDLLLAKFSLVFGFSEVDLYFRFFPILVATLWCLATFLLAQKYFRNKMTSCLTVFFSAFGGSFAYLLPLFHANGVNFDSDFGVSSPVSSLINLQFAFSIPILALTFYAFAKFIEEKRLGWGLIVAVFTGGLFGFKIYAGMIALAAVGLSSIYYLIKTKRVKTLWVAFLSGLLGILVYLPTNIKGAGLVFAPGEMIQSIIRGPLSWTLWELRRQVYAEHQNLFGLARMRILAFLVFLFGNLGTKTLGLGEILRFRKSQILTKDFGIFSFALLFSFLIPIFFIQSITPFNIVQFWWYFLYFMSFLTAVFLWDLLKNKKRVIQAVFLVTTFILTVPAAFAVLQGYLFAKTSYKISRQQLAALEFLKEKTSPNDVILEIPSSSQTGQFDFGLPIIPALAQRRVFVGPQMVEFPYLDQEKREEELRKIIVPLNCPANQKQTEDICQKEIAFSYETLSKNNINYIFSPLALFWLEKNSKISSLIYKRNGIFIYQIK